MKIPSLVRILEWLKELRCSSCGRLLCKYSGEAEVKCSKCGITTRGK